jgi:DNA-directed RNA polymerase subunit F
MKSTQISLFVLFVSLSFFVNIQISKAQYGGGYGGGGYGGGYGRGSGIPQAGSSTPPKPAELDPEKMATEDTKWMTKKLKLTEEQIPKIDNANINYAFKRIDFQEEIKKLTPPFSEEVRLKYRAKVLTIREEHDKEIKAILTEEQYQIYLKKRTD